MRNRILVIFMLFNFVVFAQQDNKTDAKGLKQGEWKKYHKTGQLRYVGSFKNDKPVGEFQYFYDTGEIQRKITHNKNGSYSITFHKTGGPQSVGKYVNQKKDSTWVYYDLDGYKIASEYFTGGLKNRIAYIFHQNGKIAKEEEFFNDVKEGFSNEYWDDGKKKKTANYIKGSLEGKVVYYNSFGIRSISGYYYHDLRNGVWIYFEDDGNKIKKKEKFVKGKRIYENNEEEIETEPLTPISEDFLNPDSFTSPR